jgi:hypothetical protein
MNKTLQEQYNLIKEGKGNKQQFFKSARHIFPDLITSVNTFEDTITILKNRGVISEGIGGLVTKGKTPDWHSIFKEKVAEVKEVKAIEKEPTKDVVDMETKGYNYKDKKNYDNVFGQEFLQGFYTEMSDLKNEGKTVEELRAIVAKNLAKDINHYVKDGQFGIKGVGYQTEAPGLGTPKEAKGKHKSSGYGDLKESVLRSQIYLLVKEVLAEGENKDRLKHRLGVLKKALEIAKEQLTNVEKGGKAYKEVEKTIAAKKREIEALEKEILTEDEEEKIEYEEEDGYKINGKNVDQDSLEVDGIDTSDYPDFADAYISYAEFEDGTPLNDSELDELNDDRELVYDRAISYLFENKSSDDSFSEYSNDALTDMIINLSRFKGNEEEIQMVKAILAKRKDAVKKK